MHAVKKRTFNYSSHHTLDGRILNAVAVLHSRHLPESDVSRWPTEPMYVFQMRGQPSPDKVAFAAQMT